jgi:anti-sigma factor RsiW
MAAIKVGRHVDEETLEKYSLGELSARATAGVEEHILFCERCRESLAASDAYVAAMRLAAAKLRRAGRKPKIKGSRKAGGKE